jgi:peptidoglycan hydrolase-like protein with peptidoglycan-binding domain
MNIFSRCSKMFPVIFLGVIVLSIACISVPSHEASAATCKSYAFRYGSSGTCVKYIQRILNGTIPKQSGLRVDGSYGPSTANVVRRFQSYSHIASDGVVGPTTWKHLCSAYPVLTDAQTAQQLAGCGRPLPTPTPSR